MPDLTPRTFEQMRHDSTSFVPLFSSRPVVEVDVTRRGGTSLSRADDVVSIDDDSGTERRSVVFSQLYYALY